MMAAALVLIVCAVLLTPGDDSRLESGRVVTAIPPRAVTPSVTRVSPSKRLPISIDIFTQSFPASSTFDLFDEFSGSSSINAMEDLSSQSLSDWMLEWSRPDGLLSQDILSGPFGCTDCASLHSSLAGGRSGSYSGGGGVGGSGFAGGLSGLRSAGLGDIPDDIATQSVQTLVALSSATGTYGDHGPSGLNNSSPPPVERNRQESLNLVSPNPDGSAPVSVPEPSTMALLGIGIAAAMMKRGSTSKRRG
jgi:hypothetical protein